MKHVAKKTTIGVLIAALLVLSVQFMLTARLKRLIQTEYLPGLEDLTGSDVVCGSVRVSLLSRSLAIRDLKIRNPAGYDERTLLSVDAIGVGLGLKGLLTGRANVLSKVELEGMDLTVVRAADERLNLIDFSRAIAGARERAAHPARSAAHESSGSGNDDSTAESQRSGPSSIRIRTCILKGTVRYIDHASGQAAPSVEIRTTIQLENVGTDLSETDTPILFAVSGTRADDAEWDRIDLTGSLTAIEHPGRATFQLAGALEHIDLTPFPDLARKAEFRSASTDLDIKIGCRAGVIDPGESQIKLVVKGFEPYGKLARRMPHGMDRIDELIVPVSLSGTLDRPQTGDFGVALFAAIGKHLQTGTE